MRKHYDGGWGTHSVMAITDYMEAHPHTHVLVLGQVLFAVYLVQFECDSITINL
jgi:hypothetical protein